MKSIILSIILVFGSLKVFCQSTFEVNTFGTSPEMNIAIDYATDIWGQYLNSDVPIKVNIYADNLGELFLGFTLPNGRKNFSGAPIADLWYASSLANSISGMELNQGEADMDIFINTNANYYFGTDGNTAGQLDFVSLILHEIGHGLGGVSSSYLEDNEGSFGDLDQSVWQPLSSSFPWLDLEGLPTVWDSFIVTGDGLSLIDSNNFPNPSELLGNTFESGDLYFSGTLATAANGGSQPPIFAPSVFAFGSSLNHFDESSYPYSSGNSLFTPYSQVNEVEHEPGDLFLAALQDIGWLVNENVGIYDLSTTDIGFYPMPVRSELNIISDESIDEIQLLDMLGKIVLNSLRPGSNDLSFLPNGTYILQVRQGPQVFREQILLIKN